MTKKIKVSDLQEFDAAEYLNSDEEVAAYLTTVLEENDSALLAATIGDIARARGMSQVAKDSGIAREALYKALRPGSLRRAAAFAMLWGCAWWRCRCSRRIDVLPCKAANFGLAAPVLELPA